MNKSIISLITVILFGGFVSYNTYQITKKNDNKIILSSKIYGQSSIFLGDPQKDLKGDIFEVHQSQEFATTWKFGENTAQFKLYDTINFELDYLSKKSEKPLQLAFSVFNKDEEKQILFQSFVLKDISIDDNNFTPNRFSLKIPFKPDDYYKYCVFLWNNEHGNHVVRNLNISLK